MTIKKYVVKSCCGKQAYVYQTDKPLTINHLTTFEGAGYTAPSNFKKHNVFYVRGHGIVASGAMGTNRLTVRCSGPDCPKILEEFAALLEKAINN